MSFPALAVAAAAVSEIHTYTGVRPAFIQSMTIEYLHYSQAEGTPVFWVLADVHAFSYVAPFAPTGGGVA